MPEPIQDKIKKSLQAADGLYHRLVLLVGESGSGKTNVLRDVAADFDDNLEILFDKDLKQDPLRLLQSLSRNRSVVASWNGKKLKGKLTYAELDHPEYRGYDLDDTLIVCMDGTTTIDFEKN